MSEITLEDHLDEICPKCKEKHNSDWKFEFDTFKTYTILTCDKCEYKIFKKTSQMTCGKI